MDIVLAFVFGFIFASILTTYLFLRDMYRMSWNEYKGIKHDLHKYWREQ